MKLQQLRYVVKVAECGSITEASRRLFVSQPSITASIRDLENEMGVHIFERTNKGVIVSEEGETFLGYARQVLDQADLLEGKYKGASEQVPHFSVSCQHYSFAVNAFVDVIREFDAARYDFTLREEQTHEIIEDVAHMKSELGILYLSEHNREVIERMLAANELVFEGLFCATPHVFVCADHPLAGRSSVTLEDLEDYPFLSYEQGSYNSFYYSEELTSTFERRQEHPRARSRDAVQPGHGPQRLHGMLRRDQSRAQRSRHHLDSARRGRVHGDWHHHAQEHDAYALRSGLYRRDSSAYLGCCAPHGSSLFMTVQTDIGNIYIKLL